MLAYSGFSNGHFLWFSKTTLASSCRGARGQQKYFVKMNYDKMFFVKPENHKKGYQKLKSWFSKIPIGKSASTFWLSSFYFSPLCIPKWLHFPTLLTPKRTVFLTGYKSYANIFWWDAPPVFDNLFICSFVPTPWTKITKSNITNDFVILIEQITKTNVFVPSEQNKITK